MVSSEIWAGVNYQQVKSTMSKLLMPMLRLIECISGRNRACCWSDRETDMFAEHMFVGPETKVTNIEEVGRRFATYHYLPKLLLAKQASELHELTFLT